MENEIVNEIGNELGVTVESVGDSVAESGHNVFRSIADAIGFDLTSLSLMKIVTSVVLLIILLIISKVIGRIVYHTIRKARVTEGLKKFIARAVRFICYFISLMIFADSIGIPVTSLVALFSLLGLAVSLSIQNLLGNIMSGISILMLKPFDIGDYIETDVSGTVKNIGLFYTEITTPDNKRIYIPNEKLIGDKLINYNAEGRRRIDVTFNAGYECDPETVKAALKAAVESVDMLLKDPEPVIGIADYGESAVLYNVWVWTASGNYFPARYALMDAVSEYYKQFGVHMAYNRLEVNILDKKM
ncbi:MAG: mechanosensitive ion channel [Clostridiales bacterium]|nr:mechanosensitive ion channel [Clostridiales bacterium]